MRFAAALFCFMVMAPAGAFAWVVFEDERFGYRLDVPPGYELSFATEQENARFFHNEEGHLLAIWFSPPGQDGFLIDVAERLMRDQSEGWDISYERLTPTWASYSGTKDGEIRYVRAVDLCGEGAAYFIMDYPIADKLRYDPIVTRAVRSMKATRC